jgi:hypothetical protein
MEVPIVLTKSSKLLKSKLQEHDLVEIPISSLSKLKKYQDDTLFKNQIKVIEDIKNELIQLDKYINSYQVQQIEKIKHDLILKDTQKLDETKNKIINEYKLNRKIFNQKMIEFSKFKKEKEQKTKIFLNELSQIANKTFNEIAYDNQVIILHKKIQDKFNSINTTFNVKRHISISPEKKNIFRQNYSQEYYKNVDRLNSDIFNKIQNSTKFTKNQKKYFIDRLNFIFKGTLDKLKNSFDKNKNDDNKGLIDIFKYYQQELQNIKKIDKENQVKRPKVTKESYSNLLDSFKKM